MKQRIIFITILISFVFCFSVKADITTKTKDKVRELTEELKTEQQKLENLKKDKNSNIQRTNQIKNKIQRLKKDIRYLNNKIYQKKSNLNQLKQNITRTQNQISSNKNLINKLIRNIHNYKTIAITHDYSPIVNMKTKILGRCSHAIMTNLDSISSYYKEQNQTKLKQENSLDNLRNQVTKCQKNYSYSLDNIEDQREELKLINSIEEDYENRIDKMQAGITKLELFIKNNEKNKIGRDYDFRFQQGTVWPLKGDILVKFGRDFNSSTSSIMNNGILIESVSGSPVKSIADGVVAYANWFERKGNMVIVDHKNGFYSLYGFNYKLKVKKGEEVEQGETISYSGINPFNNKECLYFELRRAGKPIDPLKYLN